MAEINYMSKERLQEFCSWMTAKKRAKEKLNKTNKPQAMYYITKNGVRLYKYMPHKTWKMMKPGTLGYVIQHPDPLFNGVFSKGI